MITHDDLLQFLGIGENADFECKLADGGLPKSLWETVSAFANTAGGYIILGIRQTEHDYEIIGVKHPETLKKTFWDGHNNIQKLSVPLCHESDIRMMIVNSRTLVVIHIPAVQRKQRPVYINGNLFRGCYKRNFEGDYHCSEMEARQMLRDSTDDPLDGIILHGFGLGDLDQESLKAYRQRFSARDPDHPYLGLPELDFFHNLGAWRKDRHTGEEGITLAGLLMFGRERSLLDALPHFHLDYQEQLTDDPEIRWTFRLTLDGKWTPNLFNFYFRIYPRLVEGIDVPFKLDRNAVRLGETHVHEALREALVNTLIHADHQITKPIAIIRGRDSYLFQNPGRLRIPRDALYQGGISDPRNPSLQKMFGFIGLGEKAGSGFQKILRAWREQHWWLPLVRLDPVMELTRVWLPLISMIPEEVEKELRTIIGDAYDSLSEDDRLILVMAHRMDEVGNEDIQQYSRTHPRDIGERLKYLVYQGWLDRSGHGRGTRYRLKGRSHTDELPGLPGRIAPDSEHLEESSEHLPVSSEHLRKDSEQYAALLELARPVREKHKADKSLVIHVILELCAGRYLELRTLAEFLDRKPDSIRNHYIAPLIKNGYLETRFPEPNHPQQAYRAVKKGN